MSRNTKHPGDGLFYITPMMLRLKFGACAQSLQQVLQADGVGLDVINAKCSGFDIARWPADLKYRKIVLDRKFLLALEEIRAFSALWVAIRLLNRGMVTFPHKEAIASASYALQQSRNFGSIQNKRDAEDRLCKAVFDALVLRGKARGLIT